MELVEALLSLEEGIIASSLHDLLECLPAGCRSITNLLPEDGRAGAPAPTKQPTKYFRAVDLLVQHGILRELVCVHAPEVASKIVDLLLEGHRSKSYAKQWHALLALNTVFVVPKAASCLWLVVEPASRVPNSFDQRLYYLRAPFDPQNSQAMLPPLNLALRELIDGSCATRQERVAQDLLIMAAERLIDDGIECTPGMKFKLGESALMLQLSTGGKVQARMLEHMPTERCNFYLRLCFLDHEKAKQPELL